MISLHPADSGKTEFLIGVNYWPREYNISMWKNFSLEETEREIEKLHSYGINSVRFFLLGEDFMSRNRGMNENSLRNLVSFLDACLKFNVRAFPTFVVGHMSGKNWPVPWSGDGDLYSEFSRKSFSDFTEYIMRIIGRHKAIGGWILGNEISLFSPAKTEDEGLSLLKSFHDIIREYDAVRPVSSGDILSYMQYPIYHGTHHDYTGIHFYQYDDSLVRHRGLISSLIDIFRNGGNNPVMLEEFGISTAQTDRLSQASYIYSSLWSSFISGAAGAFVWCSYDFSAEDKEPYLWRPLELEFGIMDAGGEPKEAAIMVKKFRQEIQKISTMINGASYTHGSDVTMLIPFFCYRDYTSIPKDYRRLLFQRIPNGFTSSLDICSSLSLETSAIYECEFDSAAKKLILIPSVTVLLATTWRRLSTFINEGGIVYTSTFRELHGSVNIANPHDSLTHLWLEMFGVRNITPAGSTGLLLSGRIKLKVENTFGKFKKGVEIGISLRGEIRTYFIDAAKSSVIMSYENNPVVTLSENGRSILSLIPLELLLSTEHNSDAVDFTRTFYEGIAELANVRRPYTVDSYGYHLKLYDLKNEDILVCVSHYATESKCTITGPFRDPSLIAGNSDILEVRDDRMTLLMRGDGVAVISNRLE